MSEYAKKRLISWGRWIELASRGANGYGDSSLANLTGVDRRNNGVIEYYIAIDSLECAETARAVAAMPDPLPAVARFEYVGLEPSIEAGCRLFDVSRSTYVRYRARVIANVDAWIKTQKNKNLKSGF